MYNTQVVTGEAGRPIGYLYTYDDGHVEARDLYGRVLGIYWKDRGPQGETWSTPDNRFIGYGNQVMSLIYISQEKK